MRFVLAAVLLAASSLGCPFLWIPGRRRSGRDGLVLPPDEPLGIERGYRRALEVQTRSIWLLENVEIGSAEFAASGHLGWPYRLASRRRTSLRNK
jgi:hypothetical protein